MSRRISLLAPLAILVACAPLQAQEHQHEEMHEQMTSVEYLGDNPGLPFSQAVRVGPMLYLSGQIGTREDGTVIPGGIQAETRQTMENIKTVLERWGSSLDEVVKCTVFLADIGEWPAMNEVYVTYFTKHFPARSAVAGSGLALNSRVEIECMATVGLATGG